MKGIPKTLQTRVDFERMHAAALAGEVSATGMQNHWHGLLSSAFAWVISDADPAQVADNPDYKTLDGKDGIEVYQRTRQPDARIDQLGYTLAEAEAKIAELEGI